jgi:hypothetical protein
MVIVEPKMRFSVKSWWEIFQGPSITHKDDQFAQKKCIKIWKLTSSQHNQFKVKKNLLDSFSKINSWIFVNGFPLSFTVSEINSIERGQQFFSY